MVVVCEMGRGTAVTEQERGAVIALHQANQSLRDIAQRIGRSPTLVRNCIKAAPNQHALKKRGPKFKASEKERRLIVRSASNQQTSAAKLKESLNLKHSKSTILRVLQGSPHLKYEHMLKRPMLTTNNVAERLAFAKEHVTWEDEWENVIFSDEKSFNLDGPDGWSSYWHDLRKDKLIMSKRKFGGGSVKVWIGFSYDNKATIAFYDGALTAKKYVDILKNNMTPLYDAMDISTDEKVLFQQDNDARHTANTTLNYLEEHGVHLLGWVSNSPDLAPAENVLGMLARAVYEEKSNYNTKAQLQEAILHKWNNMDQTNIRHAVQSMHERMISVIELHGRATKF